MCGSFVDLQVINNRKLSGKELQTYFQVYVKMFQAGQKTFPKAMTMLDATAGNIYTHNILSFVLVALLFPYTVVFEIDELLSFLR